MPVHWEKRENFCGQVRQDPGDGNKAVQRSKEICSFLSEAPRHTRVRVIRCSAGKRLSENFMEDCYKMAGQKIRIKLKAYDHNLVDQSAERIVEVVKKTGTKVSGPIPLPTDREVVTILRSPHKYKDSREQFELKTHKRLIDIYSPSAKTVDSLMKLDLPAGVDINIKL